MTLCASLAQTLAAESFTEAFAPDLTASHEVEHVVLGVQNIQNGVANGKMKKGRTQNKKTVQEKRTVSRK